MTDFHTSFLFWPGCMLVQNLFQLKLQTTTAQINLEKAQNQHEKLEMDPWPKTAHAAYVHIVIWWRLLAGRWLDEWGVFSNLLNESECG